MAAAEAEVDDPPGAYARPCVPKALVGFLRATVAYERGAGPGAPSLEELLILAEAAEPSKPSIGKLAEILNMPVFDVSRKIAGLAERGLVAKRRSQADRRIAKVELTELGRDCLERESARLLDLLAPASEEASPIPSLWDLPFSPTPICIAELARDARGRATDMVLQYYNPAFAGLFQRLGMARKPERLSSFGHPELQGILEACERTLASGKLEDIEVFSESMGRQMRFEFAPVCASRIIVKVMGHEGSSSNSLQMRKYIQRYKTFFDSGPIKLVIDPSSGKILDANAAARKFYGLSLSQILNSRLYELGGLGKDEVEREIARVEAEGSAIFTAQHRSAGGSLRRLEVHATKCSLGGVPVHFAILLDRGDCARAPETRRPKGIPPPRAGGSVDFSPFSLRYGGELPAVEEMLKSVSGFGNETHYRPGEHYLEFGGLRPSLGFVLEGMFRQYTVSAEGQECTVALIKPGQLINSQALGQIKPNPGYIYESRDESRVFVVELRYLQPLANSDPRWYKLLSTMLAKELEAMEERVLSFLAEDARRRLRHFTSREPDAVSKLLGYQLASYLGISSETLSRIREKRPKSV